MGRWVVNGKGERGIREAVTWILGQVALENAWVHLLSVLHTEQQLGRACLTTCVALREPPVTMFPSSIGADWGFPAGVGMHVCNVKISLECHRDFYPALPTSQGHCEHQMR